ncbi:MAG TPA: VOC family protein [Sphingomonadales bacterium]
MFDLQRVFHTGIVVDDLEPAMKEIGAALNLEWTPVKRFDPMVIWTPEHGTQDYVVEAVYSRQGPHHLEIVRGPKGSFYDPKTFPDGRHIGVWVDDLVAETERLLSLGWKIRAAGGAPEDGYGVLTYMSPPTSLFIVELVTIELKPMIDAWVQER